MVRISHARSVLVWMVEACKFARERVPTIVRLLGLIWYTRATSDNGVMCYVTDGSGSSLGERSLCPGDPAPSTFPDGSENVTADLIADFCLFGSGGGAFPLNFITRGFCLGWSTAQAADAIEGNQNGLNCTSCLTHLS